MPTMQSEVWGMLFISLALFYLRIPTFGVKFLPYSYPLLGKGRNSYLGGEIQTHLGALHITQASGV